MNRDKNLIAATDAHHRPVRVHAQRPGKGLQAKHSESLRVQDSAIQKPDQNRILYPGFQARSKDHEILEEGGGAGPSNLPRRDYE